MRDDVYVRYCEQPWPSTDHVPDWGHMAAGYQNVRRALLPICLQESA